MLGIPCTGTDDKKWLRWRERARPAALHRRGDLQTDELEKLWVSWVGRMKDVCMMKLHETSTSCSLKQVDICRACSVLEIEFAHKNVRDRVLRWCVEAEIPPTWCAASGACRSWERRGQQRVQAALESLYHWEIGDLCVWMKPEKDVGIWQHFRKCRTIQEENTSQYYCILWIVEAMNQYNEQISIWAFTLLRILYLCFENTCSRMP